MKEILLEKGKKRTNMCKFITNAEKVCRVNKQNTQKRKVKKWKEPNNFMHYAKNNAKKFYIKRRTA